MADWRKTYASYWFDGLESNSAKLVYKSFKELPLNRKLRYLGFVGAVKGLGFVRGPIKRLTNIDISELPFRDLPKVPEPVEVRNYGPTREDREEAGLESEDFLSRAQVAEFCKKGVIGPFRAISEEEAAELYKALQDRPPSKEFATHFEHPRIGEIYKSPAITAKVATLLGENLKLWRSQIFRLPPNSAGTYWHAENEFLEGDTVPAFKQNVRPRNLGQLTIWMALNPVTKDNGALRFVTGTHKYPVSTDARNRLLTLRPAAFWLAANSEFLDEYAIAYWGQIVKDKVISAFPMARATMKGLLDRYGKYLEECGEELTVDVAPGEFLIFTSSCMHGSWGNETDTMRVAVGARVTTRDAEFRESPGLMSIPPAWTMPKLNDETLLRCPEPKLTKTNGEYTLEFGSCEVSFGNEWAAFAHGLKSNRMFTPAEACKWDNIPSEAELYGYLNALVDRGILTIVYDQAER